MPSPPGAPSLPGYRDLSPIGRGGFSEVHRAWQERFDRWVAVKVLSIAMLDDRAQERFRRECRVTGRLSGHPSVVVVHDADIAADGRPYLAMQLYEGGSALDRMRAAEAPLPVEEVLHWSIQVAGALETAHRAGILHRDVKPGNILLTAFGQAALSDFGLSIVTEQQEISLGIDAITPNHAAPEVLERGEASVATDVYALASTVYTLLAGRSPHPARPGEGPGMRLLRMLQEPIPRLDRADLPPGIDDAVQSGLARDPAERPPSAEALGSLLQQVQRDSGLPVTQMTVLDGRLAPPLAPPTPAPSSGDSTLTRGEQPGASSTTPPSTEVTAGRTGRLGDDGRQWEPPPPRTPPPVGNDLGAGPVGTADVDEDDSTVARPRAPVAAKPVVAPPAPSATVPWPILVLAVLLGVALLGLLASVALGSDDGEPATTTSSMAPYEPEDMVEEVEATVTGAGIQVTWAGRADASFVLLVLSEDAAPQSVSAPGPRTILDPERFDPGAGHCITVADADELIRAPAGQEAVAFSPPACVNGASQETVQTE